METELPHHVAETVDDEPDSTSFMAPPTVSNVPWMRQLSVALNKNFLLLSRRPVQIACMLFSSIGSVMLAYPAITGNEPKVDFGTVPLTKCGTVDDNWLSQQNTTYSYDIPLTYNESWRTGLCVEIMALGPMFHAIFAFVIIQIEIQTMLLGILRGLGLRDSVFWVSWWIPFLITSFFNALFGTITASILSVHAFENIYFMGMFGSFFFLNFALVGASFFLAAVCGTARGGASTWCIVLLLAAQWAPFLTQVAKQGFPPTDPTALVGADTTPLGLFWVNRNTTYSSSDGACEIPVISKSQGAFFKTEQQQAAFPGDEFFVGCYFSAGYINSMWNQDRNIGLAILFMFPYVHFTSIWGNFLGYTGMKDRRFGWSESYLTSEQLAIASLPFPPNAANGRDSVLFKQGTTLQTQALFDYETNKNNCPASSVRDYFCSYMFQCPSAAEISPTQSPSVNALIAILFFLGVLFSFMAAYWALVFPGKNGAPRKFYFFLSPGYWFGSRSNPSNISRNRVEVCSAFKNFGGFEALKGVTMTMASGEVTALLGHNGAGKTTLSNIITCEISPTSGDISVFGYSVANDPDAVRGLVAVCKQDDYLYPDLSAKEHLELFGGLRGVAKHDIPETVQKWLESVDLDIVQDQYSSAFSGGMKRRLSLACSTIGSRPLIVLDEPTTGMDPLSRRFVWRHIDQVKEGRVILLTTHAMEEADLLADSVAIMRKGSLAALGTPLELKAQFGSPLQFTLLVDSERVREVHQEILRHFKKYNDFTEVVAGEAGNITVKITQIKQTDDDAGVDVLILTDFVEWLEDKATSGVQEYGFSNSSLEEVFLKVTQADDEKEQEKDVLDEYDVCCPGCSRCCILCCLQGCFRCCCCPRAREQNTNQLEEEAIAEVQGSGFDGDKLSSFKPVLSTRRQTLAIVYFLFSRNWVGKWISWAFHSLLIGLALLTALRGTSSGLPIPLLVVFVILLSLILITFVSPIYRDRNLGVFYLMRAQGLLKSSFLLGTGLYAFIVQFLFGLIMLTLVYLTGLYAEPEFCGLEGLPNCESKKWGGKRHVMPSEVWVDSYQGAEATVYATYQGGTYGKILGAAFVFAMTVPGAVFSSAYLPGHKFAIVVVVTISLLAAVAPLICYFTLVPKKFVNDCEPDICNMTSYDRELITMPPGDEFLNCVGVQVTQAQSSLCMPRSIALLPTFGLFQMLSMTLISDIIFTSTPPEYLQNVFIPSLGSSVKCSGASCQFPYANERYTQYLGFTVLGAILLLFLGQYFVSFFSFPSGYNRRIRNQAIHTYKTIASLGDRREENGGNKGEEEQPFEEVQQESALVQNIVQELKSPRSANNGHAPVPELAEVEAGMAPVDTEIHEGDDNEMEIEVSSLPREDLPPVLAYKLRKVYPSLGGLPPKVALSSLDLHVPKGQVLGLLGQNGAGKTTAIKIWAASHEATSGLALIAGYNVSSETLSVFERLGNCPQFDVVCPSETVQRHLEFFALLKGLPMSQVKHIAHSLAIAVGLGTPAVYRRRASQLSGGMRRRLSIAISLIGAPAVLLLDEPTTGLDPSTRNSIWNLINAFATKDRAVIITTHMMLEADTLCNRIAIMAHGRLKVVGTQQTLKDRFGSGYLLQLNLVKSTPENQAKALDFVRRRIHKDAVLQNRQAKTLRVALPRDLSLPDVFRALYSKEIATEGCVNQFLLSQSSLEDVFIALGG